MLLDAGADVKRARRPARGARSAGQTALFGAAFWGWNDVVKFLVERGAKIDAADTRRASRPSTRPWASAGGHGRGPTTEVYKDTAELLVELCKQQPGCDLASPDGPS